MLQCYHSETTPLSPMGAVALAVAGRSPGLYGGRGVKLSAYLPAYTPARDVTQSGVSEGRAKSQ